MEFRFLLDQGNEFRELLLLNKVVVRRSSFLRIFVPLLRIILIAGGLFLLLPGCVLLFGQYDNKTAGVAAALVGLVWFLLGVFYYRYGALRSRAMTLKNIGSIILMLTQDGIQEVTQKTESRFGYDAIREVYFYRNTYFLFVDRKHALILPCSKLVLGQAEDLEKTLEERCQTTVKKL